MTVARSLHEQAMDTYVHEVAAELGLGPADVVCETGEFLCAEIRFAGRAPDRPPGDEVLYWSSGEGWQVVVAEGASGSSGIAATLRGTHPAPRVVAMFVREPVASRGEQIVRRPDHDDYLTELLDRHSRNDGRKLTFPKCASIVVKGA
jgi:hypothetical protein